MMMIPTERVPLLGRLLAVYLILLCAAAMNAASAEDVAPVSAPNGHGDRGSESDAATKGGENAPKNAHVDDKVDGGSQGTKERHAGSPDSGKGGEEADTKGMRHGEDHTSVKHNGIEASPIDTRSPVFSKPRLGHALAAHDWKKMKSARRPGISDDHHRKLTHTSGDKVVRNAIGQRLPLTKANGQDGDKRSPDATVAAGIPKTPGTMQNGGAGAGFSETGHYGFVPNQAHDGRLPSLPLSPTLNHSIVNGSAMGRTGLRSGTVGGPTKNLAGVINGTDYRPRHP
jgi:hypothetical protein